MTRRDCAAAIFWTALGLATAAAMATELTSAPITTDLLRMGGSSTPACREDFGLPQSNDMLPEQWRSR